MKIVTSLIAAAAAVVAISVSTTAPVRAEAEYPWCAFLSISGGSQSCTYATLDQCRAFLAGAGFCERNPRASSFAEMPKRTR